jgi:uncharacterized protein (TIGR00369 family)
MIAAADFGGRRFLEAMATGELPPVPMMRVVEFSLEEVADGSVTLLSRPSEQYHNTVGTVHGGFAATLLDSAAGCAVHTTLPPGATYATIDLSLRYIRPILASTGWVRAEGRVLHRGKRIATAEAQLIACEDDRLLAHATSACLITESSRTASPESSER